MIWDAWGRSGTGGQRDDELPADEFYRIALEHPEVHEPLVVDALPAPEGQRELRHRPTVGGPGTVVNVASWIYRPAHPRGRPELGARAEKMAEAQADIAGDGALPIQDHELCLAAQGAGKTGKALPTLKRGKAREERQRAHA